MDLRTALRARAPQVARLLDELEAGQFDTAVTQQAVGRDSPLPRLLRACARAQHVRHESARADVDHALEQADDDPLVQLVAGIVLHTTRDYQRALDHLERASTLSDDAAPWARQHIVAITGLLGWDHDLGRALNDAITAEPTLPRWHAHAVRLYTRGRHWSKALEHARHGLALDPTDASLWMEAAGLHARLQQREPARVARRRALSLAPPQRRAIYLREAARVAIDSSDFSEAIHHLQEAIQLEPEAASLHVHLAEIDSWKGDDAAARTRLRRAETLDPSCADAIVLRGALETRAGLFESAIATLDHAVALEPSHSTAHLWLAEAHLHLGHHPTVHAHLDRAIASADGFVFVAWLLRSLALAYDGEDPQQVVPAHRIEEFDDALRELCPGHAARACSTRRGSDVVAAVQAALKALRGNRSAHPTHVVDGVLTRLSTRTGCRHRSRWALQLIRVARPETCLEQFDALLERYPAASLPHCHRGELHLWLGNLGQARADLTAAIERVSGTRWAYMGLSMLALLQDDPKGCLQINARGVQAMGNTEGKAIHAYRGEALRRLGRLRPAIEELERAVQHHPSRVSATINLALCHLAVRARDAWAPLWRRLHEQQAPGLLSDAAHTLGVTTHRDDGLVLDDDLAVAVLEQALRMMGGNRSSGLPTYRTAHGVLRTVQRWPHRGPGPHADDPRRLEQAQQLLLRAVVRRAAISAG